MINCCRFELTFLPIEGTQMLVLLPDGVYLRDFAGMLRKDDRCYTFTIENTTMLCKGHPACDPNNPGEMFKQWKNGMIIMNKKELINYVETST